MLLVELSGITWITIHLSALVFLVLPKDSQDDDESETWSPFKKLFGGNWGTPTKQDSGSATVERGDKNRNLLRNGYLGGGATGSSEAGSSVPVSRESSMTNWLHGPLRGAAPSDKGSDRASDVFSQRETIIVSPVKG